MKKIFLLVFVGLTATPLAHGMKANISKDATLSDIMGILELLSEIKFKEVSKNVTKKEMEQQKNQLESNAQNLEQIIKTHNSISSKNPELKRKQAISFTLYDLQAEYKNKSIDNLFPKNNELHPDEEFVRGIILKAIKTKNNVDFRVNIKILETCTNILFSHLEKERKVEAWFTEMVDERIREIEGK